MTWNNGERWIPLATAAATSGAFLIFILPAYLCFFHSKFKDRPLEFFIGLSLTLYQIVPGVTHTILPDGTWSTIGGNTFPNPQSEAPLIFILLHHAMERWFYIGGSLYVAFHLPKYQFHFLFWVFSMTLFQLVCEIMQWKSLWTDEFTQSAGVNAVWYIRIVLSTIGMGNVLYSGKKIHSMSTRLQPTLQSYIMIPLFILDVILSFDFLLCNQTSLFFGDLTSIPIVVPMLRKQSTEVLGVFVLMPAYFAFFHPGGNKWTLRLLTLESATFLFGMFFEWKRVTDAFGKDCLYQYRVWVVLATTCCAWIASLISVSETTKKKA